MTRRLLLALALLLPACSLDPDDGDPGSGRLIVANGGNFADQNGFLSRVDLETGAVADGPSLDGFLQGLHPVGDEVAILVNTFGDGRVDFAGTGDLVPVRSVTGIDSPRGAASLGERLFVTTFAADGTGSVLEIDPATASVLKSWPAGGLYPEGIAVAAGRVFAARYGFLGDGTSLAVIDPDSDGVGSLELGCDGPRDVLALGGADLLVVCQGKTVYSPDWTEILEMTPGQVVFVDGAAGAVTGRVAMDGQIAGSNQAQSTAFVPGLGAAFLLDGPGARILEVDVAGRTVSVLEVEWPETGAGLSGVAWDPEGERLLVGRMARGAGGLPDFAGSGAVVALDPAGAILTRFGVGPSPSHLLLLP